MEHYAARSTPGQEGADRFLRAVTPDDIERLIREHSDDPADRDFGVSTGGGGSHQVQENYPAGGSYDNEYHLNDDLPTPRQRTSPSQEWDEANWDRVLGGAGFSYQEHPNPTVVGYYWRPDDHPANTSTTGYRIEHPTAWQSYWKAHHGPNQRDDSSSFAMSSNVDDILAYVNDHRRGQDTGRLAATKAKSKLKPKPPRKPEEIWYDVHKHPSGVPGGMGKAPEHHLRNRGWNGHEINEGSGKKTIQYRNHKYPDFVISYGGGTSQKPDHNFRVLYMGTNANVTKIHRAYSVAEAMDKVEELHRLDTGLVVQPMIHGAAVAHTGWDFAEEGPEGLHCSNCNSSDLYERDFRMRQEEPDLGCNGCGNKMHSPPGRETVPDSGWEYSDDAFGMRFSAKTPTMAQQPNIALDNTFVAPAAPPKPQDMTDHSLYPIGAPDPEFPTQPARESDWPKKQKPQLKEIPDPLKVKPVAPKTSRLMAVLARAEKDTWEVL